MAAQQQHNYALPSIAAAYGLAFVPNYYNVLRMMAATGGKWSFAMYVMLCYDVPPLTDDEVLHHQIHIKRHHL